MQPAVFIVALGVFLAGIWWRQTLPLQESVENKESFTQERLTMPSPTSLPPQPFEAPTPSLSPAPEPSKPLFLLDLPQYQREWLYPGTTPSAIGNNQYRLLTSDNPDMVFDWYEEQLEQLNMRVRNRIKARANEAYNYRLNAASADETIDIFILREAGSTETSIEVRLLGPQGML